MSRNVLCAQKLFSCFGLVMTLGLLAACAPGTRDPWNNPRTASSTAPAVETSDIQQAAPVTAQAARAAKVALLLPLSGKGSDTGQAMLNASQLAIFDLGAETFELIPRDTMGTPDGARAAAQAAMNEGAQLILGPVFAADAKAVTPMALQKGLGVVSFSTDSSVAGGTSFVIGFLPQTQIRQVIDYAAAQGMPRIAIIAPQDAFGDIATSTFDTYIRQRNLMNAGIVRYNGNTGPTPEQIKQLASKGGGAGTKPFDAVLIAAPGTQSAMISTQLAQAGLPPALVKRLGTGLWDQADVARQPSLQGAWYAAASPDMRQKFEARYQQTYGETAPRLATLAYDATALAIVLARSGQPYTRQALANPNGFTGIDGIFRFTSEGLVERGLAILEIRNNSFVVVKQAPTSFQSFGG
jgi:branched-chain amino acid transport system substrate-binding protein